MSKQRDHINDICIGDKFEDTYCDIYEVMSFHGSTYVYLECSDSTRDTYHFRDEKLLKKINEFKRKQRSFNLDR